MDTSTNSQAGMPSPVSLKEQCIQPGKEYMYRSQLHTHMNFECLQQMFYNKLLCDVILVAEGVEIAVHKFMLACCSPLFYWKFSNDRKLGQLNRIEIENITYDTLSVLVRFLYTSQVLITGENVEDILGAAHIFGMRDLQDACCNFLWVNLSSKNCERTRNVAIRYKCQQLVLRADDYIIAHFPELIRNDECLDWKYDQILNIVAREVPWTAEDMLDFVIRWVRYDLQHRKDYFHSLIKHVKFESIPQRDVWQRIEKEEWLKCDLQFMVDIFKFYALKGNLTTTLSNQSSNLLMVVGFTANRFLSLEFFDFWNKVWLKGPEVINIKCNNYSHVAIHGTMIYCIEGNRMRSIDITKNQTQMMWSNCNMLSEVRYFTGLTVFHNSIYAVGGTKNATSERYDFSKGMWERIASMSESRGCVSLGALHGILYAVGGVLGHRTTDKVESYNLETDSWHTIPPMLFDRQFPGVAGLGDSLYVVGGLRGTETCKIVEVFDPIKQTWRQLPDMNVARHAPGVIAVNDQLYVVGGSEEKSVEIYDPRSNTWTMLPSEMNTGKTYVTAGLIEKSQIQF